MHQTRSAHLSTSGRWPWGRSRAGDLRRRLVVARHGRGPRCRNAAHLAGGRCRRGRLLSGGSRDPHAERSGGSTVTSERRPLLGGIIAAGEGRRLREDGWSVAKALVPIDGVALLEVALGNFLAAGIASVTVIVEAPDRDCAAC